MPVINDRLLQRIYRSGAIYLSFLSLAGCASLPNFQAFPWMSSASGAEESATLEFINVNVAPKRLPVAITREPFGPPDILDRLRDEFALSYEHNRRIEMERDHGEILQSKGFPEASKVALAETSSPALTCIHSEPQRNRV